MKHKIFLILALLVSLSSCSAYYKLLKSDDEMAKYEAGKEFYKAKKYSKAKAMFDAALPTLIGTNYEDTILFTLGKTFYESKDYNMSGEIMNQYRNKFTRSSFTPEAEYIYAMSFYKLSGDVEKDQTNTKRAISAFGEYMNRYPQSKFTPEIQKLAEELNDKLYYKKYLNGALYYKLEHYLSAITSLNAILKDDPETPFEEDIRYLICQSWFDYARNSVTARQLDRYLKTIDAYYDFVAAFPDSKQFGHDVERIKALAQDFVDKNGVTSQSIETSEKKIEAAKKAIETSKDALFEAKTKEERAKLHQVIKDSRKTISIERKKAREENKKMEESKRKKEKELKEMEKSIKAREKAEAEAAKQKRKEKVEELRKEVK